MTRLTLKQPSMRLPVRDDFPVVQHLSNFQKAADLARHEAKKLTGEKPQRVFIAFAQKHPGLEHRNTRVVDYAHSFVNSMNEQKTGIEWILADGLYEKHKLYRGMATLSERFTKTQRYGFSAQHQTGAHAFKIRGEYFVTLDDTIDAGTTMVDMMSFLSHNGGHVLFTVGQAVMGNVFLQPASKDAIEKLGDVFFESSLTPSASALKKIETRLKANGLSLTTLTAGECAEIERAFSRGNMNFNKFLKSLNRQTP